MNGPFSDLGHVGSMPGEGGAHPECHVAVYLGDLCLHFRADLSIAREFATVATARRAARVTIDDHLADGLPPLPCQRLWRPERERVLPAAPVGR